MQSTTLKARVTRSGEGRSLKNPEGTFALVLAAADTGGQFSVNVSDVRPGGGPPPHVHTREDETFYILAGEFEFLVGDSIVAVGAGDIVFGPRDVPHTFKNVGTTTGRFINYSTGANFEAFFELYSEAACKPEPDFDEIRRIAADHGIYFVEPRA